MRKDKKAHSSPDQLASKARRGDFQSIAQLLSLVEKDLPSALTLLSKLKAKSSKQIKIGITGPPGAGKSSLIGFLIQNFREKKYRVGVLAVDPSSPFSGGALLGDRIRMNRFAGDSDVFIRSVGSRGALGGLSAATGAMARVLAFAGFDILIIETVGVGQTELQVMNLADITAVVLVPESGDVIQTLKAGILEIADCFIINKSDRPGAELIAKELESLVELEGVRKRKIFLTSVTGQKGLLELGDSILKLGKEFAHERSRSQMKLRGELRSIIISAIDHQLQMALNGITIKDVYSSLSKVKIPKIKLK